MPERNAVSVEFKNDVSLYDWICKEAKKNRRGISTQIKHCLDIVKNYEEAHKDSHE